MFLDLHVAASRNQQCVLETANVFWISRAQAFDGNALAHKT
jgi:hypothetical protein